MVDTWVMFRKELRSSLRQRSFYLFGILFLLMMGLILLIQRNIPDVGAYNNMTGTLLNVMLYLLPLIVLLLGSFSITQEKEEGGYALLLTYPLSSGSYVIGKYLGQFVSQWVVASFSFGVAGVICMALSIPVGFAWMALLYLFSVMLLFTFLAVGVLIGIGSSNRWQALMLSILVWFVCIMIWPMLLLGILGFLPYPIVQNTLIGLSALNPAEALRIMLTAQLGGGAIFGQPYYVLLGHLDGVAGGAWAIGYCAVFSSVQIVLGKIWMERKRKHG
ncbi:ABC transporter permease [Brevibacillus fluminis]|uniref:ABC transporter permease n=1 Tax=Brevibacillus fluminis TaxID=511487 RepID=A0A3M8DE84_9BACL|nr:ABC transporter permease subunit [Brevibacillus fluminis]RNB85881.1 ABC transporter permease [Brevibacillus fluminis]